MSEPARGRETRTRIQAVAVELFTEQGYEKTSLREIAERLDVTKAALYYHFKSKEDIVASLAEDYVSQVDELIAWGREQPRTAGTSTEILRRYLAIMAGGHQVFRMLHQNQAALRGMAGTKGRSGLFKERLTSLIELLAGPGATLSDRLRPAMALGGLSVAWMTLADEADDQGELCAALLGVACDVARAGRPDAPPPAAGPGAALS